MATQPPGRQTGGRDDFSAKNLGAPALQAVRAMPEFSQKIRGIVR